MKRYIFAAMLLGLSLGAQAFQPRTGHWNNPNEPGRGFNIDVQDGVMVLTMYSYDSGGNPQWYIASGNMTNGQRGFSASLDKFRNGQCLSCGFAPPVSAGSDGAIFVTFATETSATVTLPGGAVTHIVPFNFKFGPPPAGMFGEWVFVETIGATDFVDRFNFTVTATGTANGSGLALDVPRRAGCEQQTSGAFVGFVICADLNSAGAAENQYKFKFGLDETFEGSWVSPSTFTEYPMKGWKVKSASGYPKAAVHDEHANLKAAHETTLGDPIGAEQRAAFETFVGRLR